MGVPDYFSHEIVNSLSTSPTSKVPVCTPSSPRILSLLVPLLMAQQMIPVHLNTQETVASPHPIASPTNHPG